MGRRNEVQPITENTNVTRGSYNDPLSGAPLVQTFQEHESSFQIDSGLRPAQGSIQPLNNTGVTNSLTGPAILELGNAFLKRDENLNFQEEPEINNNDSREIGPSKK